MVERVVGGPAVRPDRLSELYTVGDYRQHARTTRNVPILALDGRTDSDPLKLPYRHFSLVMNKTYRMLHWAASNADYRDETRGDKRPRTAFGGEDWRYDKRVPNRYQLGNDDIFPRSNPVLVLGAHKWKTIAPAQNHTCATDIKGVLYCWGRNSIGQLGNNQRGDALVPVPVAPLVARTGP